MKIESAGKVALKKIPAPLFTVLAAALVLMTLTVFWPLTESEFTNFDDPTFIMENRNLRGGLTWRNITWAFTTIHLANWVPVTWLSHLADVELYGLSPRGHHLTNILFHMANTVLLFAVLSMMSGALWRSFLVAALFSVHPLHVESVAWVTLRRDLLSTFFGLFCLGMYRSFALSPGWLNYILLMLTFALSLMSKQMLVTLPFVFLLLDYWPLNRWDTIDFPAANPVIRQLPVPGLKLFREKIPLFILTAVFSAIAFSAQQKGGALGSTYNFPLGVRIANTFISYATYIGKVLWPGNLAVFYPHAGRSISMWNAIGAGLMLLCLTIIIIRLIRKQPYLAVGWFWFLGTLVPVIGIVQLAGGALADRDTYFPLIGLFIVIAWGVPRLTGSLAYRTTAFAAALVLIALMFITRVQIGYWRNSETLFLHALKVTSNNAVAHNNLGSFQLRQGRIDESIEHFSEALEIDPYNAKAHYNIGLALAEVHRNREAVRHLKMYVKLKPEGSFRNYASTMIKYLETRPDGY